MKNWLFHHIDRWKRDISGASAIEAAICFPLILMLIFAIFQYAIFYNNSTDLNKRFSDASRQVKLMENPDVDALSAHFQSVLDSYEQDVTLSVDRVERYGEQFAEVNMSYAHTIDIPFVDQYPLEASYTNLIMLSGEDLSN